MQQFMPRNIFFSNHSLSRSVLQINLCQDVGSDFLNIEKTLYEATQATFRFSWRGLRVNLGTILFQSCTIYNNEYMEITYSMA